MQKIKPKNEISCQYYYIIKFDNQVRNTMKKDQIGKKKQKGKSEVSAGKRDQIDKKNFF